MNDINLVASIIHLISTNYNQRHILIVPSHALHKKLVNKHNKHVWKTSTKYSREFHYPTSKHLPMVPSHALQGKVSNIFQSYNNLSKSNIKSKGSHEKQDIAATPFVQL